MQTQTGPSLELLWGALSWKSLACMEIYLNYMTMPCSGSFWNLLIWCLPKELAPVCRGRKDVSESFRELPLREHPGAPGTKPIFPVNIRQHNLQHTNNAQTAVLLARQVWLTWPSLWFFQEMTDEPHASEYWPGWPKWVVTCEHWMKYRAKIFPGIYRSLKSRRGICSLSRKGRYDCPLGFARLCKPQG